MARMPAELKRDPTTGRHIYLPLPTRLREDLEILADHVLERPHVAGVAGLVLNLGREGLRVYVFPGGIVPNRRQSFARTVAELPLDEALAAELALRCHNDWNWRYGDAVFQTLLRARILVRDHPRGGWSSWHNRDINHEGSVVVGVDRQGSGQGVVHGQVLSYTAVRVLRVPIVEPWTGTFSSWGTTREFRSKLATPADVARVVDEWGFSLVDAIHPALAEAWAERSWAERQYERGASEAPDR